MLLVEIMGPEQSPDLFNEIGLVISKLLVFQNKLTLLNPTNSMDDLYAAIWSISLQNLTKATAAGTAILGHILYVDYTNSHTILSTSHSMIRIVRDIAPILPEYKVPVMNSILTKLFNFVNGFKLRTFALEASEAVKIAQKIVSLRKSPKTYDSLNQLAEMFYKDPRQRVQILGESLNENGDKVNVHEKICMTSYKVISDLTPKVFNEKKPPILSLPNDKTIVPNKRAAGAAMGSEISFEKFANSLKDLAQEAKKENQNNRYKLAKADLEQLQSSVTSDNKDIIDQALSQL